MMINSLTLKHFGKFQDKKMELQNGINLLYGDNEAGKSTIHTFIRGMLFGIEKQRGRTSFDSYTKYRPWDTPTLYDGEMEVEVDGETYVIKRNFYKEEKSLQIIHKETGREIPYKEQRGSCFIEGVTESNYVNTVLMGQQQAATGKELAYRVNNYITNMSTTQNSEVNVNQAIQELQGKRKEIESRQTNQQLKELQLELQQIQSTDFMLKELERQIISLDQKEKELDKSLVECKIEPNYLKKIQVLESFVKDYDLIMEKYNNRMDCQSYQNQIEQQIKLLDDTEMMDNSPPIMEKQEKRTVNKKTMITSVILAVLSFALCILIPLDLVEDTVAYAGAILMVIGIILIQIWSRIGNRKKNDAGFIKGQEISPHTPMPPQKQQYEQKQQSEQKKQQLLLEYETTRKRLQGRIQQLDQEILQYGNKVMAMEMVDVNSMENLRGEIQGIAKQVDQQKQRISMKQIQEREIRQQKETLHVKEEKLRWEFAKLEENVADYGKKRALRDELLEKRDKEEKQLKALEISIQTIQELSARIHDDFGERLNQIISETATAFTGGSCYDVRVDEKLNMKIVKGSDYVPMEYVSTGTLEQLYLAIRMVAADLLLKDKQMPIILDDAFVYYDEGRLEETLQRLAKESQRQILLFTCHNREHEILERCQIPYTYIEV
ncbi:ATP-binding protein [Anaerosporobacter faecicola]|uniref:ATP-binding protein n=1 Tax=Anaerosporobacter faecicola TaxID=2718714 RepID=UPI001439CD90|nr:ATP-binding protein [Anaerosporobacter faecicola]